MMNEAFLKIRYMHFRIPETLARSDDTGEPGVGKLFRYGRSNGWHQRTMFLAPHPRGGLTVCQIFDAKSDTFMAAGTAKCSLSDNFCYKTGRLLAFGRALQSLGKHVESLPVV
ncbi:MAG: hypothetical protein KAJ73_02240 [Zetaproteobacteria bacterium]|nr:hypothetical protein [Zetaproteobacteria bacterium]